MHGLEQMLREARELRVDLELHARGEEREALEQTLHVWIGALDAFHAKTGGDLGIFLGELRADFAQVLQFAVVAVEQSSVHARAPAVRPGHPPCGPAR